MEETITSSAVIVHKDLKLDSHLPKKHFNDCLSEMTKSAFYFTLKALFFLKIFLV